MEGYPKILKIGGYDISVELIPSEQMDDCYGKMEMTSTRIRISDIGNKQMEDSTLIHEIIECINYMYELKLDHQIICVLDTALYQLLRDNDLSFIRRGAGEGKAKRKGDS